MHIIFYVNAKKLMFDNKRWVGREAILATKCKKYCKVVGWSRNYNFLY